VAVVQDPIEDPRFLDEYRAFYRSREEWNALVEAHGFVRVRWAEPFLPPSAAPLSTTPPSLVEPPH